MPAITLNSTLPPTPLTSPAPLASVTPSTFAAHGIDNLFGDSFSRTSPSTHSVSRVVNREVLDNQRHELQELARYMKRDAHEVQSPLRGFSHAYYNTIQSHLSQLDHNEFSDPEVTNHFAIDFAKRYRRNLEALKDRAAGDSWAKPESHWIHAWERAEQLSYVPFVPEALDKSAHILLGKTAHIDYDLGLSLTEALRYKTNRDGVTSSPPRSLEADFIRAGDHFETTTDLTADELGLPEFLADIGNFVSDVPTHRRARFEDWVRSHEPTRRVSHTNVPSLLDLGW